MFAVVPRARVGAAFKVALVAAGYLLCQVNIAAEHLASSCRPRPRLLTTSLLTAKQSQFCLDTSLRQYRSLRPNVAPAASFDLNTSMKTPADAKVDSAVDLAVWDRTFAIRLKLTPDPTTLPHLLGWLEGWRMDIENGLFRPLRLRASRLAFTYTD